MRTNKSSRHRRRLIQSRRGDKEHDIVKRLQRAAEHAARDFTARIRITEMAGVACISRGHFSRKFKKKLGFSPREYLLKGRIAKSQALLAQTADSLAEVAFLCGYSSQSAFTTAFKKISGTTPARFRAKHTLAAGNDYVGCPMRLLVCKDVTSSVPEDPEAMHQIQDHRPVDHSEPAPIARDNAGA